MSERKKKERLRSENDKGVENEGDTGEQEALSILQVICHQLSLSFTCLPAYVSQDVYIVTDIHSYVISDRRAVRCRLGLGTAAQLRLEQIKTDC